MSHACMSELTDIGRASQYEQKSRTNEVSGVICEYWRRLRECVSTEQSTFMHGDACVSRHVRFMSYNAYACSLRISFSMEMMISLI